MKLQMTNVFHSLLTTLCEKKDCDARPLAITFSNRALLTTLCEKKDCDMWKPPGYVPIQRLLTTLCEKKDCDMVKYYTPFLCVPLNHSLRKEGLRQTKAKKAQILLDALNHSLRKEGLRLGHPSPLFQPCLLLTTLCEKKDCDLDWYYA